MSLDKIYKNSIKNCKQEVYFEYVELIFEGKSAGGIQLSIQL
jgi:hypothetical protein